MSDHQPSSHDQQQRPQKGDKAKRSKSSKKPQRQQQQQQQQQPPRAQKGPSRIVTFTQEQDLPGKLHQRFSQLEQERRKQGRRAEAQQAQRHSREALLYKKRGSGGGTSKAGESKGGKPAGRGPKRLSLAVSKLKMRPKLGKASAKRKAKKLAGSGSAAQ